VRRRRRADPRRPRPLCRTGIDAHRVGDGARVRRRGAGRPRRRRPSVPTRDGHISTAGDGILMRVADPPGVPRETVTDRVSGRRGERLRRHRHLVVQSSNSPTSRFTCFPGARSNLKVTYADDVRVARTCAERPGRRGCAYADRIEHGASVGNSAAMASASPSTAVIGIPAANAVANSSASPVDRHGQHRTPITAGGTGPCARVRSSVPEIPP